MFNLHALGYSCLDCYTPLLFTGMQCNCVLSEFECKSTIRISKSQKYTCNLPIWFNTTMYPAFTWYGLSCHLFTTIKNGRRKGGGFNADRSKFLTHYNTPTLSVFSVTKELYHILSTSDIAVVKISLFCFFNSCTKLQYNRVANRPYFPGHPVSWPHCPASRPRPFRDAKCPVFRPWTNDIERAQQMYAGSWRFCLQVETWSVHSQENRKEICFQQMSYFKAKMHQIRFRLGLCPRTGWRAYSAPQIPSWI